MTDLSDVVRIFEGKDPIAKNDAVHWLTAPDLELAGAAYAYLENHIK
jgi:hypothetical protein